MPHLQMYGKIIKCTRLKLKLEQSDKSTKWTLPQPTFKEVYLSDKKSLRRVLRD